MGHQVALQQLKGLEEVGPADGAHNARPQLPAVGALGPAGDEGVGTGRQATQLPGIKGMGR